MGSASSKTRKDKAKSSTTAACPTDTAAAKACPTRLDDGLAQVAMFGLRQVTMGVLRIDYDYQTNLGDILDPRSFDFRLVSATVEGLTFKRAQEGEPLPCCVMSNLDGAVKKLIDAGADFIVGDCGFLVYWQVYVRDFAQQYARGRACPVMLSSLVLSLPLLATIPVGGKIGILTASKGSLMKMQKKLASVIELQKEEARTRAVPAAVQPSGIEINFSDPRFKVVGLDTVNSFKTALADDSGVDDRRSIAIEIAKYCKQVACEDPAICAWLIECTEAGGFSWAIKLGTGLPVWDPVTIGRFLSLGFTSSLPSVALTLGETGQVALDPNETDVSKGRPTKAEHRFGPEFEEMLQ